MHMWRQIMFLQRAAGTSRAEFLARWPDVTDAIANGHGPKPRRIVENHPLDPMEQGLCGDVIPAAYDGVYEFWFCSEKRSEEHTSELQSLMRNSYAVFCLKKKKQLKQIIIMN